MIRLTVEQLYALQKSIQVGGQAHTAVLPFDAMNSHRLIIAWARGRAAGDGLYLCLWRNDKSWTDAIAKDQLGLDLPYDYINDEQSAEYTHTYPIDNTMDSAEFEHRVQRIVQGSAADAGHPEFGVTHGE